MTEVAVLTGTLTGMGLHAAAELARAELTVVATVRDTSRAEAAREAASTAGVDLDVAGHEATRSCLDGIAVDHGRIDVLANNSGRGSVATAEQLTMQQVRDQLEVNYLGAVALTQAVLPAMREAGSGWILTVTSVGARSGSRSPMRSAARSSPWRCFMQSLAVVAERFGIWVSVLEPGSVASDFVANGSRPAESGPYDALLAAQAARSRTALPTAQSAQNAGASIAAASSYRFPWQTSDQARASLGFRWLILNETKSLATPEPGSAEHPWIDPVSSLWPIHLTGVTWAGGCSSCWRAVPEVGGRGPSLVPDRCRLSRLSGVAALACGFLVSGLWPRGWLAPG
jgi:NAD(P)-dependent dehydrogenase (short-subunit alcohol dehydrogenase family)